MNANTVHTSEIHLFPQFKVWEMVNGHMCGEDWSRSPIVPLESSVMYFYCSPHFPQPLIATREITLFNTFCILTIFLIHKMAQHLSTSIMYFYLFCLFTLTNIRKSECIIVLLSGMWMRTVSNLFMTAQWKENWWLDHDNGIMSFRKTKSSHFINGETRMAVVMYLLQIHCFSPTLDQITWKLNFRKKIIRKKGQ